MTRIDQNIFIITMAITTTIAIIIVIGCVYISNQGGWYANS